MLLQNGVKIVKLTLYLYPTTTRGGQVTPRPSFSSSSHPHPGGAGGRPAHVSGIPEPLQVFLT